MMYERTDLIETPKHLIAIAASKKYRSSGECEVRNGEERGASVGCFACAGGEEVETEGSDAA